MSPVLFGLTIATAYAITGSIIIAAVEYIYRRVTRSDP